MDITNNAPSLPKRLEEVTLDAKIKVVLSTKAYAQIAYLLQHIHNVEWSAILLYTVEGHITTPEKMVCRVDSLYLMDKGTAAYTEHNYDNEDIIDMIDEHSEYLNMKWGHIHSHNNMRSYFSGTDMGELHNNAPNHTYYLSLIVNNAGEYVAKLAYIGKQLVNKKISLQNKVGKWVWAKSPKPVEEEVLFIHNCVVVPEMADGIRFVERFKKVVKRAEQKEARFSAAAYGSYTPGYPTDYRRNVPSTEDKFSYPPGISKYMSGKVTTSMPTVDSTPNRTKLAKVLISCNISDEYMNKPLMKHVEEAEEAYKSMNTDDIEDSYAEFFLTSSPEFLVDAYKTIYMENPESNPDKFYTELDKAVAIIPGRIGEVLTQVVDLLTT